MMAVAVAVASPPADLTFFKQAWGAKAKGAAEQSDVITSRCSKFWRILVPGPRGTNVYRGARVIQLRLRVRL